jgi:hypothetical protein
MNEKYISSGNKDKDDQRSLLYLSPNQKWKLSLKQLPRSTNHLHIYIYFLKVNLSGVFLLGQCDGTKVICLIYKLRIRIHGLTKNKCLHATRTTCSYCCISDTHSWCVNIIIYTVSTKCNNWSCGGSVANKLTQRPFRFSFHNVTFPSPAVTARTLPPILQLTLQTGPLNLPPFPLGSRVCRFHVPLAPSWVHTFTTRSWPAEARYVRASPILGE